VRPGWLVAIAWRSLRRAPVRSLLTMLGVIIGVASVIVMVGLGLGAQAEVEARVLALGTNLIVVTPGSAAAAGVSAGAGSLNRLSVEDATRIADQGTAVAAVSPVVTTRTQARARGTNWRTALHGVGLAFLDIRAWPLVEGRPFTEDDLRARRKVCLLGSTVDAALFPDGGAVGQRVLARGVPLEVVGVLETRGPSPDGVDQDDVILVPSTTAQARLAGWQTVSQILVQAESAAAVPAALDETRTILRASHRLADWQEDDFTVRDQAQIAAAAQGTTRVLTLLLAAIASVSLLVGGIGIMNIMLVSVTERTREIGVRRALGARRRDILAQFLVESVVLSGLGGVLGAALGVGGAAALGAATGWSTAVSPPVVLGATAFSAGVGVLFGWVPARRAAALDPIEALRSV
jgi:putative ABC transport system permease protein